MNLAELHANPQAGGRPGWRAALSLRYARRGERTVLAENRHVGPLRVQRPLYPEGEAVCQTLLLHPPSGLVGGDALQIDLDLGPGAQAQVTTPGAGKWYRSAGDWARQTLNLRVAEGAVLEWLPQETLFFDACRARAATRIDLAADARLLYWDIQCLGRQASGEAFERGELRLELQLHRAGRLVWRERGGLGRGTGPDPQLTSPVAWAGLRVNGTWLLSLPTFPAGGAALLETLRAIPARDDARRGLTYVPGPQDGAGVLVARYLGQDSEAARHWFTALWQAARPTLCGRDAVVPRIWST